MEIQTGFLLSYIKYGDHDAVLNCFTMEKGFQSFFAHGIYSAKNKKKAYLLPMNELCFTLKPKIKNNSIQNISKIELVENPDFYQDVKCNSIVFFTADFLNQILRNEDHQEHVYNEILRFLNELENKNYSSHLFFLIKILEVQGLLPLANNARYLDPESGNFYEDVRHTIFNSEISAIWKTVIEAEDSYKIHLESKTRKAFLSSILIYYHFHYPDFRVPNSLEIVQQIFE